MDYASKRRALLAEAVDLQHRARAYRLTVDQSVVEVKALTATSRATSERAWQTLDRINRSLRHHQAAARGPRR
ncbi:MAG: hypothetical protein JO128_12000 [Alphaproteobacteria bacterium]|nr:hypothetical protein [Alphaproteobacteria bacterium]